MIFRAFFLAMVLFFAPEVGAGGGDLDYSEQQQAAKTDYNSIEIKVAFITLAGTLGAAYLLSKKRK